MDEEVVVNMEPGPQGEPSGEPEGGVDIEALKAGDEKAHCEYIHREILPHKIVVAYVPHDAMGKRRQMPLWHPVAHATAIPSGIISLCNLPYLLTILVAGGGDSRTQERPSEEPKGV